LAPFISPSSYECGSKGYEAVFDTLMGLIEPISSLKPYMVLPGNHEVACHSFEDATCEKSHRNFTPYNHRFRMPSIESGATT